MAEIPMAEIGNLRKMRKKQGVLTSILTSIRETTSQSWHFELHADWESFVSTVVKGQEKECKVPRSIAPSIAPSVARSIARYIDIDPSLPCFDFAVVDVTLTSADVAACAVRDIADYRNKVCLEWEALSLEVLGELGLEGCRSRNHWYFFFAAADNKHVSIHIHYGGPGDPWTNVAEWGKFVQLVLEKATKKPSAERLFFPPSLQRKKHRSIIKQRSIIDESRFQAGLLRFGCTPEHPEAEIEVYTNAGAVNKSLVELYQISSVHFLRGNSTRGNATFEATVSCDMKTQHVPKRLRLLTQTESESRSESKLISETSPEVFQDLTMNSDLQKHVKEFIVAEFGEPLGRARMKWARFADSKHSFIEVEIWASKSQPTFCPACRERHDSGSVWICFDLWKRTPRCKATCSSRKESEWQPFFQTEKAEWLTGKAIEYNPELVKPCDAVPGGAVPGAADVPSQTVEVQEGEEEQEDMILRPEIESQRESQWDEQQWGPYNIFVQKDLRCMESEWAMEFQVPDPRFSVERRDLFICYNGRIVIPRLLKDFVSEHQLRKKKRNSKRNKNYVETWHSLLAEYPKLLRFVERYWLFVGEHEPVTYEFKTFTTKTCNFKSSVKSRVISSRVISTGRNRAQFLKVYKDFYFSVPTPVFKSRSNTVVIEQVRLNIAQWFLNNPLKKHFDAVDFIPEPEEWTMELPDNRLNLFQGYAYTRRQAELSTKKTWEESRRLGLDTTSIQAVVDPLSQLSYEQLAAAGMWHTLLGTTLLGTTLLGTDKVTEFQEYVCRMMTPLISHMYQIFERKTEIVLLVSRIWRQILRDPTNRPCIGIGIRGAPGSENTSLMFQPSLILGANFLVVDNPNMLQNPFCAFEIIQHILIFHEISHHLNSPAIQKQLQKWVTGESRTCRRKFLSSVCVQNFTNHWFLTNHESRVDNGACRYIMGQTPRPMPSECYKQIHDIHPVIWYTFFANVHPHERLWKQIAIPSTAYKEKTCNPES